VQQLGDGHTLPLGLDKVIRVDLVKTLAQETIGVASLSAAG
jgi:hypothetical protein